MYITCIEKNFSISIAPVRSEGRSLVLLQTNTVLTTKTDCDRTSISLPSHLLVIVKANFKNMNIEKLLERLYILRK
jgi:hypothetical protein